MYEGFEGFFGLEDITGFCPLMTEIYKETFYTSYLATCPLLEKEC
jgi:hypothetical protein